jgi:general secretion pathway protein K
MKSVARKKESGIALIIVMISVTFLGILAAAFAYSMKVETKLAQNANSETELIWLGRSGVERARWYYAELKKTPGPYENDQWPGVFVSSNSVLADISLKNYELGEGGKISVTITDLERKLNINIADEAALQQALRLVGVDAGDLSAISASILDWIDPDDNTHIGGTESDYYQGLTPPYFAKNKPIDDLSELLLVRGVTPEIYWGGVATNHQRGAFQNQLGRTGAGFEAAVYPVGLSDLFTPISSGKININTASAEVLQLIPGVDSMTAEAIVAGRQGGDDGSGLLGPYRSVGDVRRMTEVNPALIPQLQRFCEVESSTFEVQVEAEIAGYKRTFIAILGCNPRNPKDVQVLSFYWK